MSLKLTTEDFIRKAKEVHGEKYSYSNTTYFDATCYVAIGCPKHGEFYQVACRHLFGNGCAKCAREENSKQMGSANALSNEEYILRCKKVFPNYDYSKTEYSGADNHVTIICKKHGEFQKKAEDVTYYGFGCPACTKGKNRKYVIRGKRMSKYKGE